MKEHLPPSPRVLISAEKISERVRALAHEITIDIAGRPLVVIGVLTGALVFLADLIRVLPGEMIVDLMRASSYGAGTSSGRSVSLSKDIETDITGRHVLVVEDIVDSGHTLSYLLKTLEARGPASLRVCTLLNKPSRREVPVPVTYSGFEIPDVFVVGYGLDRDGRYRHLPYVGTFDPPSAA